MTHACMDRPAGVDGAGAGTIDVNASCTDPACMHARACFVFLGSMSNCPSTIDRVWRPGGEAAPVCAACMPWTSSYLISVANESQAWCVFALWTSDTVSLCMMHTGMNGFERTRIHLNPYI